MLKSVNCDGHYFFAYHVELGSDV